MLRTFKRTIKKLHYQFENEKGHVIDNLDSFDKQLDLLLEQIDIASDVLKDEISSWGESITDVNLVNEIGMNPLKRIDLKFMRIYVNKRYAKALDDLTQIGEYKKDVMSMKHQVMVLKAWK